MEQRLQKLLADAGIGSRRSCEELIAKGRVTVNGVRVTEMGVKANPVVDDIRVNGRRIGAPAEHMYIVLNKPLGYVCTVSDSHAEKTVMDLVKQIPGRIYPVGRLDADSAGLLLMSNDGEFTERLTHPSHQVPKTYRAVVRGDVTEYAATDMRNGILLDDGMTAPAKVEWVDYDEKNNATIADITIHEGRNRQVRRMFEAVGYPVLALTRIQIGPINLIGLKPGTWRKLRKDEVAGLLASADSTPESKPSMPDIESQAEWTKAERTPGYGRRKDRSEGQTDANPPVKEPGGNAGNHTRGVRPGRPLKPRTDRQGELDDRLEKARAEARAISEQLGRDREDDDYGEPGKKKPAGRPVRKKKPDAGK